MRATWNRIILAGVLATVAAGGGQAPVASADSTPGQAPGKPQVYVAFYPMAYFAGRIGGAGIDVVFPMPDDADCRAWIPDTATVQAFQQADLIILNGARLEKWVDWVSLPGSRLVDTAKPFEKEFINFEKAVVHSHGTGGAHAHEGLDPSAWMDPVLATIQAEEISKALCRRFPAQAATFEKNLAALKADLAELDAQLKSYQAVYQNQPLLVSHPVFNYIARRYQWNIKTLDLEPDTLPEETTVQLIQDMLKTHPAKYVIWESEPEPEVAAFLLQELGLTSLLFSPCEMLTRDEVESGNDYIKVMRQNVVDIRAAFH